MPRRLATLLLLSLSLALAPGCGDDDDSGSSGGGAAGGKAAEYERAVAAMEKNDFDTAIQAMTKLGDYRDAREKSKQFRRQAARETLANARTKLKPAPRAAVSLTQTSLRYHPTPEARAFLPKAKAAHERFKRSGQDDD